jgi:hypothetical protein
VPLQGGPRPSACIGVHSPRYAESPAVPIIIIIVGHLLSPLIECQS